MSIAEKFIRNLTNLFNYSTDENPTTQADYMAAVKNWVRTEEAIVDSILWQPTTAYTVGNAVKTPSLPSQYYLICTTAGTSGSAEPDYTDIEIGDTVTDGTVTWKVDGVLPLSGGTMTGTIIAPQYLAKRGVDDGFLGILGGSSLTTGAYIGLSGKNRSGGAGGQFAIHANDGTNDISLIGKPDGTLTWTNGLGVALYKNSGYGYLIISNNTNTHGVQICWGAVQNATSAGITVTFSNAFPTGANVRVTMTSTTNSVTWATDITTTNFKAHSATTAWANYIAIANY